MEDSASGQVLNGSNTYEIKFPKDSLPDSLADAFWSVTLYSVPDYRLIENPINKYGVNNVTGAQKNKDGSLSIWISPVLPKGVSQANWIPSGSGKGFTLTFRLYVPKENVLNGSWLPPAITKVK